MSAVFGTSQQDGCCFVSAPRTVNILGQTQLQVACWLALGSWAGLQRPINRDINMEGELGDGGQGGHWGLSHFWRQEHKGRNLRVTPEVEAAEQGGMRPHLVPVQVLTQILCNLTNLTPRPGSVSSSGETGKAPLLSCNK